MNFEKYQDYVTNRHNFGQMEDPSGYGEAGNLRCGDQTGIYIRVEGDVITECTYYTFGCGFAQAVGVIVTKVAKGKTIEEAKRITPEDIAAEIDGFPSAKAHYAELGVKIINNAVDDYLKKKAAAKATP